jgi:hypothetical protein
MSEPFSVLFKSGPDRVKGRCKAAHMTEPVPKVCAQDPLLNPFLLPAGHRAQSRHVPECQNHFMI